MEMDMCLFCKMVSREVPAQILFEDDDVFAFADIRPATPTHALVIPKRHITSLNDAVASDAALLGKMMITAQKMAEQTGISAAGWRAVVNTGADAGQSVFHVHIHVLGGRPMAWPPG
jgi:histidine triad (HIT) family protein